MEEKRQVQQSPHVHGTRMAAAILLALALSASWSTPASADHDGTPFLGNRECPHGGNYVATACLLGVTHYGLYAEWHNNFMSVAPGALGAGMHINNSIWSFSGSPCTRWVEIGTTRGYYGNDFYGTYVAWNTKYGYDDAFVLPTQTWDGSNHTYYLKYEGAPADEGRYSFWRDGGQIGFIDGLGFGSCMGQGGLEFSRYTTPPDSSFHADTFNLTPLRWQNTGFAWQTGWTGHWMVQYPCGQYPVGQCSNGVYNSASHWADNKP
jgi:hypothetical protein